VYLLHYYYYAHLLSVQFLLIGRGVIVSNLYLDRDVLLIFKTEKYSFTQFLNSLILFFFVPSLFEHSLLFLFFMLITKESIDLFITIKLLYTDRLIFDKYMTKRC
jgi:hypothetical protein